jgi:hypothetical protein
MSRFDSDAWVNFKLFGILGLTVVYYPAIALSVALCKSPAINEQTDKWEYTPCITRHFSSASVYSGI